MGKRKGRPHREGGPLLSVACRGGRGQRGGRALPASGKSRRQLGVGTYRVIAAVDEEGSVFQVFGYSPVRVPEGARPVIAETIARANFGLRVDKFEMDYDQGELRFQAAQILTDDSLDEAVIDRLMGTTISMLDMYLPAVLSVIYGNEPPKDAIRCVEARRCHGGEVENDERGADD